MNRALTQIGQRATLPLRLTSTMPKAPKRRSSKLTHDQFDEFLDILKLLIHSPAVSGCEEPFFRVLRRELEDAGATVSSFEGLLCAQGADPTRLILSAHADRHGLICTGPNEFQYAAFIARNRGDLQGDSISEQTFELISGRFRDHPVQAYAPWSGGYLGRGAIRDSFLCSRRGAMIFDVEGLSHVLPGTPVAYLDRLRIEDGMLVAQLDNVISIALLVWLFRRGFQGTALISTQEEAGRSWRFLHEWFQRADLTTDRLLVLDTSPYPDRATAEKQQIVLRRRDAHSEFNQTFVAELQRRCQEREFSFSYKEEFIARSNVDRVQEGKAPRSLGLTELGRLVVASGKKITGATLQIPTIGYHTPFESASIEAVRAALSLVAGLAIS